MMTDVFKSQRAAQSKDASRELVSSIRTYLADPKICTASLSGSNPAGNGFTKTQIKDAGSPVSVMYQTGTSYLNNLITLSGLELKNYKQDSSANPKVGKADLIIKMDKVGSTVGGSQLTTTVLVQVNLDTSNNVLQCHALGSADSLWQISPSNKADVYFQGGNVGIGTANPAVAFDVAGGIRPGSAGVGTGGGCAVEGAFAYDSSAHTPVFCDKTLAWAKVGMSTAPTKVDCVGSWVCNVTTSTYTIYQAASNGGASCPYASGATKPCGWSCTCGAQPLAPWYKIVAYGSDMTGTICAQVTHMGNVLWTCTPQ